MKSKLLSALVLVMMFCSVVSAASVPSVTMLSTKTCPACQQMAKVLTEINAKYKVDAVVTHTAPSFCELITKDGLMGWATRDAALLEDCERERTILDQIFESLLEAGHPITHWYYGHFHQSWSATINGILFSMLDIMEFKELR